MDEKIIFEKVRLVRRITRDLRLLRQITAEDGQQNLLQKLEELLAQLQNELEPAVHHALVRVNLRDEKYIFTRAIDGDTIAVQPPKELESARDVRIRLYGIDTPEMNEKHGALFQVIVHEICTQIDNKGLCVIWEREQSSSEYGNFPRTSFERGIGNIFIKLDEKLLYLNGLLLFLPHVNSLRRGKELIRGSKYFRRFRWFWHEFPGEGCDTRLPEILTDILKTTASQIIDERDLRFPNCLLLYPIDILKASSENPGSLFDYVINSTSENGCPYWLVRDFKRHPIRDTISNRLASAFDIPLLLIDEWKRIYA